MLEVKEVVRLWLSGVGRKAIARRLGRDPKTVRRYVRLAEQEGLKPGGELTLSDAMLARIIATTHRVAGRDRGEGYGLCETNRDYIAGLLKDEVILPRFRRRADKLPGTTGERQVIDENETSTQQRVQA